MGRVALCDLVLITVATLERTSAQFIAFVLANDASRAAAGAEIQARGGRVAATVSGQTTYLVAGANTGATKTKMVAELGVQVLDESAFLTMLGSGESAPAPVRSTAPQCELPL